MSAIDFSDDPRAVLIHFNEKHDRLGRFAKKSDGVSATPAKSIDSKKILDEVKSAWSSGKENQGVDLMVKDGGHFSSRKRDKLVNDVIFQLASAEISPYDAQVGVINSLTSSSMIENTPDLKNLVGYDRYHDSSDYKYAARKIAYEAESIMGDAFKDFGYTMSVNELYSGSQEQYRRELIDMVCEKLEDRMKSQPYSPNGELIGEYAGRPAGRVKEVDGSGVAKIRKDDLRPAAREKVFGGFASAHRRVTSADQAYKMASEQRSIDIKNRIKKESENAALKKAAEESNRRRKDLEKKLKHVDYTDDPRAVLVHFNENHDRLGRFAKKSGGVSSSDRSKNIFLQSVGGNGLTLGDYLRSEGGVRKREHFEVNVIIPKMVGAYLSPENIDSLISDSSFVRDRIGGKELHTFSDYDAVGSYVKDLVRNDVKAGAYELADMLKFRDETPPFMRDSKYTKTGNTIVAPSHIWGAYDTTDEEKREQVSRFMSVALENGMESVLTDAVNANLLHLYLRQPKFGDDYLEEDAQAAREHWSSPEMHRDDLKAYNAEQAYQNVSKQRAKDIQNNTAPKSASEAYAAASAQRNRDLIKKLKHVDYTDDPRAVLIHRGGGNPYHDPKTGQFTTATGLGIGKYIDSKGNLTEEGKRRLAHDKKRNAQKKKDDQVKAKDGMTVDEILTDPHRWVKEDLSEIESGLKAAGTLTGDVSKFLKSQEAKRPAVRKKRLRLKDMTDAELQAQINRYLLEQRYEDIFNPKEPPEVSKGKKFLMNTLEVTGGVLAVGASAVTIAKALHELKKGS